MTPASFIALGLEELANLLVSLLKQGRYQEAADAAEELARRIAFEEAQRRKVSLWRRMFGK